MWYFENSYCIEIIQSNFIYDRMNYNITYYVCSIEKVFLKTILY